MRVTGIFSRESNNENTIDGILPVLDTLQKRKKLVNEWKQTSGRERARETEKKFKKKKERKRKEYYMYLRVLQSHTLRL